MKNSVTELPDNLTIKQVRLIARALDEITKGKLYTTIINLASSPRQHD